MASTRSIQDWDAKIHQLVAQAIEPDPEIEIHPTDIHEIKTLASFIDHTLLKPDASDTDIDRLCEEAVTYKFKSCCVNGCHISRVAAKLSDTATIPCAVIGFPLGAMKTNVKAYETREAIKDGAKEIDMVINVGALKSRDYTTVYSDIRAVVDASGGHPVKVILETALLSADEKVAGSFIAAEAGAAYVKTCTGFLGGGACTEDVALMKRVVKCKGVLVKASGGVKTFEKCMMMLHTGADRIGTSSGVAILEEAKLSSALH